MTALTPTQSAGVLTLVTVDKAARTMEAMPLERVIAVVSQMTTQALTQRLSEVAPQRVFQIPPAVLLEKLPQIPAEYVFYEAWPLPFPGLPPPVSTPVTPTITSYIAPITRARSFASLLGSPVPLTKLLVKFARDLENVGVRVEELPGKPAAIPSLPSDQKVHSYTSISLENVAPADVIVGHLTFKVEKTWLSANKINKWSVALLRYDEASRSWDTLPTKRIDEDAQFAYYSAVVPRFSIFAVSGKEEAAVAEFAVTNLTITPAEATVGARLTISADVANISTRDGTYTSTLWINSTVEDAKSITLAAGRSAPVSFTVVMDTPGAYELRLERLIKTFTVLPPKPAVFTVADLSVSPAEVEAGKAATVSVKVTNVGETRGSYTVRLLVNQVVEATREVALDGGASTTVSFTVTKTVPGAYEVAVERLTARFKALKPAAFIVSDLKVSPAEVKVGEAATLSLRVGNTGETRGSYTVRLLVNQAVEATKEVALDGAASTTVSFSVTKTVPGAYEVVVEKLSARYKVLKPAAFVASDLAVSPTEVKAKELVTVSVKVTNQGEVSGSYTARLLVDDKVEATKEVTVAAGASAAVSFTVTKEKAATYKVAVEQLSASFIVKKPMNWVLIIIIILALVVIAILIIPRLTRKKPAAP